MDIDQLTESFVAIIQCVSLENALISPDAPLSEVLENSIDVLDLELATACFEATHRVLLDYGDLIEMGPNSLTIRKLITDFLVTTDPALSDPLFVTKSFVSFRNALLEVLKQQSSDVD